MAENTPAEPTEPTEPTPAEPTPPQGDETDWKAEARKWEARAKKQPKDDPDVKAELERISGELAEVKAEAERLKAEKARNAAVNDAAKENEVDVELLSLMSGDTPEQIAENAKLLKAKIAGIPAYPNVDDNGAGSAPSITKEQIMKIKNPAERVEQIAKHSALFR